jgi:Site-specific recombinase XerD
MGYGRPRLLDQVRDKIRRKNYSIRTEKASAEVQAVLSRLSGTVGLMLQLIYGTGMRIMECVRLRVKDIDFGRGEIVIREGKGFKDRVTMLPQRLIEPLRKHLNRVKPLHEADLAAGYGEVYLPYALVRKYLKAARAWGWQICVPFAKALGGSLLRGHTSTSRR